MTIEIRDASLEARIRKQLQATGSSSVEEVLPLAGHPGRTGPLARNTCLHASRDRARLVAI
jgi:hypothetical protein